jgi:hypothetical protein
MQLEKMKEQNQKFSQPAEAKAYTVEGPRLTQWRGQSLHSGGAKAYTVEGQGLHSGGAKAYTMEGPRLTQWRGQGSQCSGGAKPYNHTTLSSKTHTNLELHAHKYAFSGKVRKFTSHLGSLDKLQT